MIVSVQRQIRELGKENQKLQTDLRIAQRNASQPPETQRPSPRLGKDEQMEVR